MRAVHTAVMLLTALCPPAAAIAAPFPVAPLPEAQSIRDYHMSLAASSPDDVQPDVDSQMTGSGIGTSAHTTSSAAAASPNTGTKADQNVDGLSAAPNPAWEKLLLDDPEVAKEYKALMVARWQRDRAALAERTATFKWQYDSTKFMFKVVHAFLFIATIAAIMEFAAAYKKRKEAPSPQEVLNNRAVRLRSAVAADVTMVRAAKPAVGQLVAQPAPQPPSNTAKALAAEPETELKIGLEGIALKTALHGLLILAMAMGFYFMYLKFVYPITEVAPRTTTTAAAAGDAMKP